MRNIFKLFQSTFFIAIIFVGFVSRGAELTSSGLFFETVKKQFKSWDKNRDGQLSSNELDDAVVSTKTIGKSAAAVAALKRASRSTKYTVPPLTLNYIRETCSEPASPEKPDFQKMFKEGLTRITNATNRELFATGHPQLATVHQGKLGN
jgi:Ca2+-binding EF-hand superfamily protein